MKILFFIGSLGNGGKERRLVELLTYLKEKKDYEVVLLLAFNQIDYPQFYNLNIDYIDLQKKTNSKDIRLFLKIHHIIKQYKPDIIHTWGSMQTFYMIPSAIIQHMPLINSQITDAPPKLRLNFFSKFVNACNFRFASIILANSKAGLRAYGMHASTKSKVIYNGINLNRFTNFPEKETIKEKYQIQTKYTVVMSASFSLNKDYQRFYKVASYVTSKNRDITFIGVGAVVNNNPDYDRLVKLAKKNNQILFPGPITDVEALVNACDIGVLFSTQGEGISNAILEYMALGKAAIVDECGGTPEYIKEGENGFFTTNRSIEEVGDLIIDLINKPEERKRIGNNAIKTIQTMFTLEQMGKEFEMLYRNVLENKKILIFKRLFEKGSTS